MKEGSDELAVVNAGGSVLPPPLEHVLVRKALCKNNCILVYTQKCRQFYQKKHFYVNFMSPKGLYRHSQIFKKGLYRHSQICRFFEHGFDPPLPLFGGMLKKPCKIGAGRFSKTARCDSKIHLLSDPCLIILLPCPNFTL